MKKLHEAIKLLKQRKARHEYQQDELKVYQSVEPVGCWNVGMRKECQCEKVMSLSVCFSFLFPFFFFCARDFLPLKHANLYSRPLLFYTISLLLFAPVCLRISRTSNHHLKKNTSFTSVLWLQRVKSVLECFGNTKNSQYAIMSCKLSRE